LVLSPAYTYAILKYSIHLYGMSLVTIIASEVTRVLLHEYKHNECLYLKKNEVYLLKEKIYTVVRETKTYNIISLLGNNI